VAAILVKHLDPRLLGPPNPIVQHTCRGAVVRLFPDLPKILFQIVLVGLGRGLIQPSRLLQALSVSPFRSRVG